MAVLASPAPQLTCDDLPQLQPSLDRFRPLFPRRDQAGLLRRLCRGAFVRRAAQVGRAHGLRQLDGDMNQVLRPRYFAADSPCSD